MTRHIKTVIWLICLVLILGVIGVILAYYIGNQTFFLESRAECIRCEVVDSYSRYTGDYYSLVTELIDEAGDNSLLYSHKYPSSDCPEAVSERIGKFTESVHMTFDSIELPSRLFYPPDACVFRKTVHYANGDVFCWIDLVYSPSWEAEFLSGNLDSEVGAGIIIRLDNDWCVVKLYGF